MVNVRKRRTTALPKSGCFRQRNIRNPAMMRWGTKPMRNVRIFSAFFDSEYESQSTSPSLAISAGWTWIGPRASQRLAPPPTWPKPRTHKRSSPVTTARMG
jgi:hypothetical protein